jgi:Transglutaminase-like superfamily
MVTELLKNNDFGTYTKNAEKTAGDLINPGELAGKSKSEQLEMLVDFVKANFSWNGQTSEFAAKSVREFLKEKTGNSANINLFLVSLLNASGLEAYPVIISTRDHGKIKSDYPFAHFFNDVIVLVTVDGKPILTDATQALCPYNAIPPWCINEKGLVIKKNAEEWVRLTNEEMSAIRHDFVLAFKPEGDTIDCTYSVTASNYDAFNYRKEYQNDTEKVGNYLLGKGYSSVDSVSISDFENVMKNYTLAAHLKHTTERSGDKIYFSPFMLETPEESPLIPPARLYPVDMTYLKSRSFNSVVKIPDGFIAEYIPANYSLKTNYLDVEYNAVKTGDHTLTISARYDFKKALYDPGDYINLRYTLNEIIKRLNEKVVLKRVSNPSNG